MSNNRPTGYQCMQYTATGTSSRPRRSEMEREFISPWISRHCLKYLARHPRAVWSLSWVNLETREK